MSAAAMVCHVTDHLHVALDEVEVQTAPLQLGTGGWRVPVGRGMLWFKPARIVMVHWLPWPKGWVGASPEMLRTTPGEWSADIARLHETIDRAGSGDPAKQWGAHPVFGRLAGREWGRICWMHLNYHLRQFGV